MLYRPLVRLQAWPTSGYIKAMALVINNLFKGRISNRKQQCIIRVQNYRFEKSLGKATTRNIDVTVEANKKHPE